jgi:mevalonate kinase
LFFTGQEEDLLELDLKDVGLNLSWSCSQLKEVLGDRSIDGILPRLCTSEILDLLSGLVAGKNIPQEKIQLNSGLYAFLFLYTSILGYVSIPTWWFWLFF